MGLDIQVCSNCPSDEALDLRLYGLSRDFCTLMCRRQAISEEPELDQIGRIASVGIQPLYDMETYVTDLDEGEELQYAANEAERVRIRTRAHERRERLTGNIDVVSDTVAALIVRLSEIDDLAQRLLPNTNTRLDSARYFAKFREDPGDGYIGNNFGQDLRNLQRYLANAKTSGATTVYFQYG